VQSYERSPGSRRSSRSGSEQSRQDAPQKPDCPRDLSRRGGLYRRGGASGSMDVVKSFDERQLLV
jgi:hypothetical protein